MAWLDNTTTWGVPFLVRLIRQVACFKSMSSQCISNRLLRLAPVNRAIKMKSRITTLASAFKAAKNKGNSFAVRKRSRFVTPPAIFTPDTGLNGILSHSTALPKIVLTKARICRCVPVALPALAALSITSRMDWRSISTNFFFPSLGSI